ncbi:MAG: lytic murein transglycosylase [Candidatus Paceibacterota bacterium]
MKTRPFSYTYVRVALLSVVAVGMVVALPLAGHLWFYEANAQTGEDVEARKARLQKELQEVEAEIRQQQQVLNQKRTEAASIERDIAILDGEIKGAQLEIRRKEITIEQLGKDINVRTETIEELEQRVVRSKDALGQLVRETDEMDSQSLIEVLLAHESLSAFFVQLDDLDSVRSSLDQSLNEIRRLKDQNHTERQQLSNERDEVQDARAVIQAQKEKIEANQAEKNRLLSIKRGEEQTYESLIAQREQRAREIRSALFALRDSAAIPFGQALSHANQAQRTTGIRPAFLLAILQQESELGENVGTCNRPGDAQTWKDIMPGPNDNSWRDDQTNFLKIMNELGMDPVGVPLSCPWGNGWGGAMGPSQFIPTTWLEYAPRIRAATGTTPDPWNPEHAFMASALYLTDLGAANGGYTAERTAALKYYAGGNWNNPQNAFYGDQVMNKAQNIQQTMIDPLQN